MLVLSRKKEESIVIGDSIEIKIIEIKGDQIKIGIIAPRSEKVYRKEIFLEIQSENIAATAQAADIKFLNRLISKNIFPKDRS